MAERNGRPSRCTAAHCFDLTGDDRTREPHSAGLRKARFSTPARQFQPRSLVYSGGTAHTVGNASRIPLFPASCAGRFVQIFSGTSRFEQPTTMDWATDSYSTKGTLPVSFNRLLAEQHRCTARIRKSLTAPKLKNRKSKEFRCLQDCVPKLCIIHARQQHLRHQAA